ncbi:MAG: FIVAR domain-containing protein [Thomasclavelia sp.]
MNKAQSLDGANYSAKTWNVAVEALDKAKEVLIDPEATQEEVDNAKAALAKAVEGLVVENSPEVKSGDTSFVNSTVVTGDVASLMSGLVMLSALGGLYLFKREE